MPNSSDKRRDTLYEEYEDSLFRLVMYEAAAQEGRIHLEESAALKNDPDFSPSENQRGVFRKQLNARLKKDTAAVTRRRFIKALNRVAVFVLVLAIAFSVAMVSVSAFRIRVLNLLIDVQNKYTSFQLGEGDASGTVDTSLNLEYMPAYVPEGFKPDKVTNLDSIKGIFYKNADGLPINYNVFSAGTNLAVDSENASRNEPIDINGHSGTLIVKAPMVSIVWEMDGKLFVIQGSISVDDAVNMAKSVKLTEKG